MFCSQCGNALSEQAVACPQCGAATAHFPVVQHQVAAKDRTVYILLGVLLGIIGFPGVHNLYAGNVGKGLTQLLVSVLTCWILWIPMYIWTIVEVCTETVDSEGRLIR